MTKSLETKRSFLSVSRIVLAVLMCLLFTGCALLDIKDKGGMVNPDAVSEEETGVAGNETENNMSRFMTDLSAYKNLKKVTFNGTDFAAGDLKLPEGCAAVINGRAAVGAMSGIETAEAVRTDKVVKAGRSEKAAPERSKVLRGIIAGKRAMMSRNRA